MGSAAVTVWQYKGTLAQLFGTGLLNAFGPQQSGTITDGDGILSQGDDFLSSFALSGGTAAPLDYIGAGSLSLVSLSALGIPLVTLSPVPVVAFQSGGAIWLMLPQGFPSLLGLNLSSLTAKFTLDATKTYALSGFVACFAAGTRLLCPDGEVEVEDIRVGDALLDIAGRRHWVVWCGRTVARPVADWPEDPRHPVRIPAHAFGPGRPRRDLVVSRSHRILVEAEGGPAYLRARQLVPALARIDRSFARITYHHVLTRDHAALVSENLPTESFFPGPVAMDGMDPADIRAIRAALDGHNPALAYPQLSGRALRAFLRQVTEAA